MRKGLPLTLLLDEGTPVSVARPFEAAGHRVIRHADVLSPGDNDRLVAAAAIINEAALVACDADFRQIGKRFGHADSAKHKALNLIFLGCSGVLAPKRVEHLMSLVEHEWEFACRKRARALWLEIGPHHFKSCR